MVFLKESAAVLLSILPLIAQAAPPLALALPSKAQLRWQDAEVGMFIHFAPNTWFDNEGDDLSLPLAKINPTELDTDQWVKVAKDMGAKHIVFVAKHVGGFCWWQTKTTDYSVRSIPWRAGKGDVMADLAASCKKAGIGLGVYLSPCDRKHDVEVGGHAKSKAAQAAYEELFRQQLEELLTHYGPIMEVWFDGSLVFDVRDLLVKHAPDAVVFQGPAASIRWVGNEDGTAPYPAWNGAKYDMKTWGTLTASDGDIAGDRWLPNECDARMRNTWFWRTDNAATLKTVPQLMAMYERSVGHGAFLLLNHTPDPTGLIPVADALRAAEFGAEIERRYGTAATDTTGSGKEIEMALSAPRAIESVTIMEDIAQGERVRTYVVEGRADGAWRELSRGTAIGHKKIDRFLPQIIQSLRLRVTESNGVPKIRRFAAFAAVK
ncbi:hypothetical protein LBMAG49_01840 [Planctomycetota bacterium]|nr:hypothetical protein LBMAG49_01840 [Planctomycetota bacterium]